ncbi:chaperonin 10-like protein [Tricharina praecox]|uniref:chaperonin 10-like protein n=1 Tax=Tricharina praecox TaxID=43433 RepID=UPI00222040CE|nr:chaperonin 10-like protein [Tricharina praecox]KAI5843577.1 chaperonin 10-like protein [Tricharina praecox]
MQSSTSPKTEDLILSSVLHGPKDLRIQKIDLPPPKPDELQIQIRSTTLCGSDLHYYNHYRNGDIIVKHPLSLGHESSGCVVSVGTSAWGQGWRPGDRVALEVGIPCGDCARCLEGRYNICSTLSFRSSAKSTPHHWGTLQERINHPAKWCHRIPDEVSFTQAALLEPLGVALHCTRRTIKNGSLVPGASVLVIGAGAVGMLIAAAAGLAGASTVVITDINAGRVEFARQHGWCTHSHVSQRSPPANAADDDKLAPAKAAAAEILAVAARPGGVDVVYECTGMESCAQTAIFAARPGGAVMLVGMGTPVMTLPISAAAHKEIDILGGFRYANMYPLGIVLLGSGKLPGLEELVTHTYEGLDRVEEGFKMAGRVASDDGTLVVKVEVQFNSTSS